jgi:hypothetical protein
LQNLRENIEWARKIWIENLKISATPIAHSLLDGHTYEQHKSRSGIWDKLEHFAEKGHQRLECVTNIGPGTSGTGNRCNAQKIHQDPHKNHTKARERICLVHQSKKRKLKCLCKEERQRVPRPSGSIKKKGM